VIAGASVRTAIEVANGSGGVSSREGDTKRGEEREQYEAVQLGRDVQRNRKVREENLCIRYVELQLKYVTGKLQDQVSTEVEGIVGKT